MNKINLPENQSALPLNEIKNLVSVGEIVSNNNNTTSNLPNQTIYSNKVNLIGKNASQYIFSNNKSEIHSPENNSHTLEFEKSKIALVKPTFTDAAYHSAFYNFYRMYENVPANTNVTSNLNLLTSKLSSNQEGSISNVYAMLDLIKNLKWITNNSNITILSDQDVDSKSIFNKNGSNLYDIIILGHQEYVTQDEYNSLKKFVSNGGTMILLDGNALYAQVKYDRSANQITLVKGHGWAFNGKSAWKSVDERWENETSQWVGSTYLCAICHISYLNNPFGYIHHEEDYITNPTDIILLNYPFTDPVDNLSKNIVIATYEHNYNKGKVIALGLYSDDIINNGVFDRFFDSLLVKYALHND
jgi:N,N-dimethylformamidase beta subunit-like, C-terminal